MEDKSNQEDRNIQRDRNHQRDKSSQRNKRNQREECNQWENPNQREVSHQKQEALGERILQLSRNRLYRYFPYMDGAFASLSHKVNGRIGSIGVDGEFIYFEPTYLVELYSTEPGTVWRGYLHMLLHCLYLHILPPEKCNHKVWNIACDIAVESIIEDARIHGLKGKTSPVRRKIWQLTNTIPKEAQQIYRFLMEGKLPVSIEELEMAFAFDNHELWHEQGRAGRKAGIRRKWEKILAYTGQNKNHHKKKAGTHKGDEEEDILLEKKGKYDYRSFLKEFTKLQEEVELDMESFDYIFYHLGMQEYGNMPLIEPLEYKEVYKLQELVIAIDTSSSCSAEVVRRFLEETYEILSDRENFFRKMKVYIIQCDCYVQDVVVIESEEQWKEYCKHITIQGRGGTDFRPVFRYVDEQIKKKELKDLKALIYFTDGDGIFPREKSSYETAFVFLEKTSKMELVPPWAKTLIVQDAEG